MPTETHWNRKFINFRLWEIQDNNITIIQGQNYHGRIYEQNVGRNITHFLVCVLTLIMELFSYFIYSVSCYYYYKDCYNILDLSFNSTRVSDGSWLFCRQYILCSIISFWCMFGVNVEVWTKNFLFRFIEDHAHFGMPRGAKMSLIPNEPINIVLYSH